MRDTYSDAITISRGLQDLDGPNVNPMCHTRVYTHGRRVENALVLLHGFTNCPQQFDALGRRFFERGWNVVIPRYPRHGYTDRLNDSISELRADHLVAVANRASEVGAGLGERLTVAGLSLGGILTGLLAQTRDDVERAVPIAPMLGLRPIPAPLLTAMGAAARTLPNFYVWWNDTLKEKLGPPYGYPRFSTHAYAALFECGRMLTGLARREAPKARSIVVVTNANEPRLDNRFTYRLVESWRAHGANVETFEFARSDGLTHDVIDPGNAGQKTNYVYPIIARLIEGA
ncbi:MAG: alpha/beta fold hydrolase [Chloroflexi bacterium]|nr:MAG: alpha/beta fold hydrolase [Chloroflexota bacterium]